MLITARRAWVATSAAAIAVAATGGAASPATAAAAGPLAHASAFAAKVPAATPAPTAAAASAAQGKANRPTSRKAAAKHRRAIRMFRRALGAEAPAGTIAHFKGSHAPGAGKEPWSIEGWVEFGGGDRYRYVQVPPRGEGQPGERQIVWGRGPYWAVTDVMRTDRGLKQVTNVGYTDPAVAYDGVVLALRYADDAQALFDSAPAGPAIQGKPTRAVPVALPFPTGSGTHDITWLLDATTRKPVRLSDRLAFDDGTVMNDSTTDFSLWEQLPAGTAAGMFGGDVPLDATIQSTP